MTMVVIDICEDEPEKRGVFDTLCEWAVLLLGLHVILYLAFPVVLVLFMVGWDIVKLFTR